MAEHAGRYSGLATALTAQVQILAPLIHDKTDALICIYDKYIDTTQVLILISLVYTKIDIYIYIYIW